MKLSRLLGLDALIYWFTVLEVSRQKAKADLAEVADKKERGRIAVAFNNRYTYRKVYTEGLGYFPGYFVQRGNAWMCPDCNKIHLALKMDGMTGVHYPSCCSSHSGHRLYYGIEIH